MSNRLSKGLARWQGIGVLAIGLPAAVSLILYGVASRAERLFWKAEQLSAVVLDDSRTPATPAQVAKAIQAFEQVIRHGSGTSWAAKSYLALGSLYAMQRQYGQARAAYAQVCRRFASEDAACLAAQYGTTKTFEAEDNLVGTVAAYEEIAFRHPYSMVGLEAPLSIARAYARHGDSFQANDAYWRAVRTYLRRAVDAPSLELQRMARGYLALAYSGLGQTEQSAKVLEALLGTEIGTSRPFILLSLEALLQTHGDPPAESVQPAVEWDARARDSGPSSSSTRLTLEPLALRIIPATQSAAGPTTSH